MLDTLIAGRYARAKHDLRQRVNVLLEQLWFQVRLCMEEQPISLRQYAYVRALINTRTY